MLRAAGPWRSVLAVGAVIGLDIPFPQEIGYGELVRHLPAV
jgi:hypothetical protein